MVRFRALSVTLIITQAEGASLHCTCLPAASLFLLDQKRSALRKLFCSLDVIRRDNCWREDGKIFDGALATRAYSFELETTAGSTESFVQAQHEPRNDFSQLVTHSCSKIEPRALGS